MQDDLTRLRIEPSAHVLCQLAKRGLQNKTTEQKCSLGTLGTHDVLTTDAAYFKNAMCSSQVASGNLPLSWNT